MEEFQEWRLGAETEQLEPKVITEAIDTILNHYTSVLSAVRNAQ